MERLASSNRIGALYVSTVTAVISSNSSEIAARGCCTTAGTVNLERHRSDTRWNCPVVNRTNVVELFGGCTVTHDDAALRTFGVSANVGTNTSGTSVHRAGRRLQRAVSCGLCANRSRIVSRGVLNRGV